MEVAAGDDVLWAFDAFNVAHFLKVSPSDATVKKGKSQTVTVVDGMSGAPIQGAVIDGVTTDANGNAVLTFPKKGRFTFKATEATSLRSNALKVHVV